MYSRWGWFVNRTAGLPANSSSRSRIVGMKTAQPAATSALGNRLASPAAPPSPRSPAKASGVQAASPMATTQARGSRSGGRRTIPSAVTSSRASNDTRSTVQSFVAAIWIGAPAVPRSRTSRPGTRASTTPRISRSRLRASARKASRPPASASAAVHAARRIACCWPVFRSRKRSIPSIITSSRGR